MRSNSKALGMLAMMAAMMSASASPREYDPIPKRQKQARVPKGHKRFVISGIEVWAMNERNAIKKANKIYLQNL